MVTKELKIKDLNDQLDNMIKITRKNSDDIVRQIKQIKESLKGL